MQMNLTSKLPEVGTTIFTVMSALAQKHNAVNLSQGFPDFDGHNRLKALVSAHIEKGDNQYAPMAGLLALRETLSWKLEDQHGYGYNPESEICITAGATQAIFTAILALVHPGDEVIIIEPAYDCYAPAIKLAGGQVIRVPFDMVLRDLDTRALDEAISSKTRMIIINSPHNPSGHVISGLSMKWLEKRLEKSDIQILSDEVYEHIIFDGAQHESVIRYPGLRERSMMVSSFGKTFHTTGWKMGYCVAPTSIMNEFKKVHQFNVFCVNRPIQHALATFMKEDIGYKKLNAFYQQKRDFFCDVIKPSRFKIRPSAGTYFQVLDYSEISQDKDMDYAVKLTKEKGLASIPVSAFYAQAPEQYLLRFCFAKNEDTLIKAAEILNRL
jgi:methionine transaminase